MGVMDGQIALVTGASRGIGKAIAEAFAREGAAVAVAARTEGHLRELCERIALPGRRAVPITMDLRSEQSIRDAVSRVRSELGPIDVLVNNAGVLKLHRIARTPTDVWDELMSVNVRGVFITCREVMPEMIERREGRIINVGSSAGRRGYVEQGAYCASKHALAGLTKVLSLEGQPHGIRVNMLSPGGVLTELSRELRASRGEPEDSPEWMTPEEVAQAAVYLCTQTGAGTTDELILRRYMAESWR